MINILKGKLNKKDMSKWVGVRPRELDKSLARLSDMGYIKYRKIKGANYRFTLYPEPVRELTLNNEPG